MEEAREEREKQKQNKKDSLLKKDVIFTHYTGKNNDNDNNVCRRQQRELEGRWRGSRVSSSSSVASSRLVP